MELLDCFELDSSLKRSHRVRSWYLYEQYKSLEENQLDAVRKLKDRSCQEKILHQEMCERRARRKLYDKIGLCQSDVGLNYATRSKSGYSVCSNDVFESICGVNIDGQEAEERELNIDDYGTGYNDGNLTQCFNVAMDAPTYKGSTDKEDENFISGGVTSVKSSKAEELGMKEELELAKQNIAENINMQLENAKENLQCLEKFSKLLEEGTDWGDNNSSDSVNYTEFSNAKINDVSESEEKNLEGTSVKNQDNSKVGRDYLGILAIWSKMVSFAYQIIQLHHGNCYHDYSFQFMTAVLLCDILRKGLAKMFDFLQPYTTPIKFCEDSNDDFKKMKNIKNNTKLSQLRFSDTHFYECHPISNLSKKYGSSYLKKYQSENITANPTQHYLKSREKLSLRGTSEPHGRLKGISIEENSITPTVSTNSTLWPEVLNSTKCSCNRCKTKEENIIKNPMAKLIDAIDDIIKLGVDFSKPVL